LAAGVAGVVAGVAGFAPVVGAPRVPVDPLLGVAPGTLGVLAFCPPLKLV
jgi:hypothetical protein